MSKIKQFIARADAEGYTAAQTELEEQRKVLERAGFWAATGNGWRLYWLAGHAEGYS